MCSQLDATGLYGVSTMLVAVLESLDAAAAEKVPPFPPPASLRKGIVAGSSVPEALMKKVQSRLGLDDLVICYGMTETSPVSCMTGPSDPFAHRTSTVGTPMPHTTVKIVNPLDRTEILPIGERGELAASGYLCMKGYFNDDAKTAEVRFEEDVEEPAEEEGQDDTGFKEKKKAIWVYSGDEACMDRDGFVQITGRIKDLIIRGGENIHPLEIENCLFQMPGVKEVSVVGVPDERLGEAVAAFVIRKASQEGSSVTEEGVREWVKGHLSGHLVPKHVFWVEEYPKTASGKIQKFKLKYTAEKKLAGIQPTTEG